MKRLIVLGCLVMALSACGHRSEMQAYVSVLAVDDLKSRFCQGLPDDNGMKSDLCGD